MDYKKILKDRLDELGLSPIQAAEKFKMPRQSIRGIFEGHQPGIDKFIEIAEKLGINPAVAFLNYDFEKFIIDPKVLEHLINKVMHAYTMAHKIPTSEMLSSTVSFLYEVIVKDGKPDCAKIDKIIQSIVSNDSNNKYIMDDSVGNKYRLQFQQFLERSGKNKKLDNIRMKENS
ncbi:MAG: helix-turn-helix transcriptional regulator [Alphaproteobacteria bacterium]|nr:helix-turn-helix transcriptional regulator [Alphaproteobacteria bacterium]